MVIELSRRRALALGLLICPCEHRENQHFKHGKKTPCAHCDCHSYRERAIKGARIIRRTS